MESSGGNIIGRCRGALDHFKGSFIIMVFHNVLKSINPLLTKLSHLNYHTHNVVSRYHHPQLKVVKMTLVLISGKRLNSTVT